jgi:uncharacterized membrane protein YhaH (DUF805 family)
MMSFADERGILQMLGEVVRRTFDFQGRARRADGLAWYLIVIFASEGAELLLADRLEESAELEIGLVAFSVLLMAPLAGWSVRRLHDINQSGWWAVALLVPLAGLWSERSEGAIALLWFVLWIMLLVWPPSKGDNRFGRDPRQTVKQPT